MSTGGKARGASN